MKDEGNALDVLARDFEFTFSPSGAWKRYDPWNELTDRADTVSGSCQFTQMFSLAQVSELRAVVVFFKGSKNMFWGMTQPVKCYIN